MQVQTIFIITWSQICKHVGQDKNISIYDLLGGKQCYMDVINDVSNQHFDLVYQHFLFALFVHQRNKQKCYHQSRRIILSENSRNKRIPTIFSLGIGDYDTVFFDVCHLFTTKWRTNERVVSFSGIRYIRSDWKITTIKWRWWIIGRKESV